MTIFARKAGACIGADTRKPVRGDMFATSPLPGSYRPAWVTTAFSRRDAQRAGRAAPPADACPAQFQPEASRPPPRPEMLNLVRHDNLWTVSGGA